MQIHILDSIKGSLFLSNGAHIQIPEEIVNASFQKVTNDIKDWAVSNQLISNSDTVALSV